MLSLILDDKRRVSRLFSGKIRFVALGDNFKFRTGRVGGGVCSPSVSCVFFQFDISKGEGKTVDGRGLLKVPRCNPANNDGVLKKTAQFIS